MGDCLSYVLIYLHENSSSVGFNQSGINSLFQFEIFRWLEFENIKSIPAIVEKKLTYYNCREWDKAIFSNCKKINARLDKYHKIVEN